MAPHERPRLEGDAVRVKASQGQGWEIVVCFTRTRLLCQKERGLKKQRQSKRSWASKEGGRVRLRIRVRVRRILSVKGSQGQG